MIKIYPSIIILKNKSNFEAIVNHFEERVCVGRISIELNFIFDWTNMVWLIHRKVKYNKKDKLISNLKTWEQILFDTYILDLFFLKQHVQILELPEREKKERRWGNEMENEIIMIPYLAIILSTIILSHKFQLVYCSRYPKQIVELYLHWPYKNEINERMR